MFVWYHLQSNLSKIGLEKGGNTGSFSKKIQKSMANEEVVDVVKVQSEDLVTLGSVRGVEEVRRRFSIIGLCPLSRS